MNFIIFKKYWFPAILYAGVIFYLSSIPTPPVSFRGIDLSPIHIPLYFVLSYLLFRALSATDIDIRLKILLAIIISTIYGVTDEIHQLYVPGRFFSPFDMLLNFIGSSLILFKLWRK